jgi:hypothetical protein
MEVEQRYIIELFNGRRSLRCYHTSQQGNETHESNDRGLISQSTQRFCMETDK